MPDSLTHHLPETHAQPRWRHQASASVRIALVFYVLLVVYASCYPFSGWRDNGLLAWTYLFEPMPRYWTVFDLVVNVIGYVPLGALVVLALYPFLRGTLAVILACVIGILLAALLESLQSYLPSRVPSNLDLITNTTGVIIGACAGQMLRQSILERSWLRALRQHWFSDQASRGLIIVALWPLAQIYPQPYAFGHGQLLPTLSAWLSDWLDAPIDLTHVFWSEISISVEHFLLAEVIITALGMTGAVLTFLCQTRRHAPRVLLAVSLVVAAIAVKTLAQAILFAPDDAFSWLTPAAASGLLVSLVMLGGLSFAPAEAQRRAAIFALVTCLLLLNLTPSNPYFLATLQEWVQGKFLNFNGAAQFLSLSWPFFALWFLTHRTHDSA